MKIRFHKDIMKSKKHCSIRAGFSAKNLFKTFRRTKFFTMNRCDFNELFALCYRDLFRYVCFLLKITFFLLNYSVTVSSIAGEYFSNEDNSPLKLSHYFVVYFFKLFNISIDRF